MDWLKFFFSLPCVLLMAGQVLAADLAELSRSPGWLSLGHYHRAGLGGRGFESYVDDPDFFLSPRGKFDPLAELQATIAVFGAQHEDNEQHPVCRYPARLRWLRTELGLEAADRPSCSVYRDWRGRLDPGSVTLVFASAYLNSPSSMYGHTLLRIDPVDREQDSLWLSWAVNFGARIQNLDNSILYAWRGLGGGYPGLFTVQPYYEKIQSYSRLENRDLWEYRLNLGRAEVATLVEHLWELRDIEFDYYFLDENCSFRLLELLDVARPGIDLAREFPLWAIPLDTVRVVERAGLIDAVAHRPAHATRLQNLADGLTEKERALARALAEDLAVAEDPAFAGLGVARQRLVALTAYRYLRYEYDDRARDAAVARRSHGLLRLLNRLGGADEPPVPRPDAPEDGHLSARLDLSLGQVDGEDYGELQLGASYHDLLDNRTGYQDGAAISLGRIRVRAQQEQSPQLEKVDLVEIVSLSPRSRFFDPLSWRVQTGIDRIYEDSEDSLVPQVNGGAGYSWERGPVRFSALAVARLEYNPLKARNLDAAAGLELMLRGDLARGGWLLQAAFYEFGDGDQRSRLRFGQQIELQRNLALRLEVERQRASRQSGRSGVRASLLRYF